MYICSGGGGVSQPARYGLVYGFLLPPFLRLSGLSADRHAESSWFRHAMHSGGPAWFRIQRTWIKRLFCTSVQVSDCQWESYVHKPAYRDYCRVSWVQYCYRSCSFSRIRVWLFQATLRVWGVAGCNLLVLGFRCFTWTGLAGSPPATSDMKKVQSSMFRLIWRSCLGFRISFTVQGHPVPVRLKSGIGT